MKTTFSDVDSAESHSINDKYSEKKYGWLYLSPFSGRYDSGTEIFRPTCQKRFYGFVINSKH